MPDDKELTATELILSVLEDFGEAEGRKVLVIYSTDNGDIIYRANVYENSTLYGMSRMITDAIREKILGCWKDV